MNKELLKKEIVDLQARHACEIEADIRHKFTFAGGKAPDFDNASPK